MYDKPALIFEIIKTAGLLYELRHGGPNKLMCAMDRFNDAASAGGFPIPDRVPQSAPEMACAYLEWIYNDAPMPTWLSEMEAALPLPSESVQG